MSSLPSTTESSNPTAFVGWPAALHPDHAERLYYGAREKSRRWVDGLRTRSGAPRWARIRTCGAPVALFRVSDFSLSWEPWWCRDRACYACARSRSRRLAAQLRTAVDLVALTRPQAALYFVTLTRVRQPNEGPRRAWSQWQRNWAAIRHTKEWQRGVVGGVRALEATWSNGHQRAKRRFPGWHVHGHCVFELVDGAQLELVDCPTCSGTARAAPAAAARATAADSGRRTASSRNASSSTKRCATCCSATHKGDGKLPRVLADILVRWIGITGGSIRAQCAVPLVNANAGQLTKYVTKMFELPDDKARELFEAIEGRRIIEGFGTWRRWRGWGSVERTPHGWCSSSLRICDIERMNPSELVTFSAHGTRTEVERPDAPTSRKRLFGAGTWRADQRCPYTRAQVDAMQAMIDRGDDAGDLVGIVARARAALDVAEDCAEESAERDGAGVRDCSEHAPRRKRSERTDPETSSTLITVAAVSAGRVLAALRRDGRPVWERIEELPADHAERCATTARIVAERDHVLNPHHHQRPRDGPLRAPGGWEH